MKTVILAFSGGLDTSYCALYLAKEKNLEVHTVTVNTGGFNAGELNSIAQRANALGVKSHTVLDQTTRYYKDCIKYLVYGNVLKNNTYPLSVSAERVFQAMSIASFAKKIKADYIAHGSTGAGNDQVRFDMVFGIMAPGIEIITPIRDMKLSRQKEIDYLKQHGIGMDFTKASYSVNKGLWGTSIGGNETLTSDNYLPEHAFSNHLSAKNTGELVLHFKNGEVVGLNENKNMHPVDVIQQLEILAAPFAIGRDIHVGDTIIGIKGRVGFESPAPLMIIKAHHGLEKHVLSKSQLMIKDQLSLWYGNWLHEGLFLDPVMRNIEAFLESSQTKVEGEVYMQLKPYHFVVKGVKSPNDLMGAKFGTYGEENPNWSGEDVKGFTKIFGNAIAIYHQVNSIDYENA